jgi:hypothetical protein
VDGVSKIEFRRSLNAADLQKWEELLSLLEGTHLNSLADQLQWLFEKSGKYSTKNMYRWTTHRGVVNRRMRGVWDSRLPMRIKVFLWQAVLTISCKQEWN